ncbi:RrF2 family transcriptional regulator [Mongoliitalea daihaiensis]|uniref:RrF2 family transcriptional regulator n=1 Tax=Mongoliitalea daihaiensis TaxID=2782006 RepID=UPI001F217B89|nr:Rrf2 family transcriptional regulator [Mongoliitalea daihaiensis]UJP63770.1 Rrf2 family transcriptional regulator [Mongoliitalea daihaiensis]
MLSKKAKYALKTILYLHAQHGKGPIAAKTIAESEKIPYKFLENILRELKSHQVVKSTRGAVGGYTLAKNPEEITVAQLMRMIDGPIALIPCVSEKFYESCGECTDEETCSIRKLFARLRFQMVKVLDCSIVELSQL